MKVIVFKEEGSWVATALEHYIVGHGETLETLLSNLSFAIAGEMVLRHERPDLQSFDEIMPAPDMYWQYFDKGEPVALKLPWVKDVGGNEIELPEMEFRTLAPIAV